MDDDDSKFNLSGDINTLYHDWTYSWSLRDHPNYELERRLDTMTDRDHYPTPREFIELLALHEDLTFTRLLDPACGDGRMKEYAEPVTNTRDEVKIVEVDIIDQDDRVPSRLSDFVQHDFLTWETDERFDLILTNPPYSNDMDVAFAKRGLELLEDGGKMILLFKMSFLASRKRWPFNNTAPLRRVYALAERPKFVNGKTDYYDYGWFVWQKGYEGNAELISASLKQLDDSR